MEVIRSKQLNIWTACIMRAPALSLLNHFCVCSRTHCVSVLSPRALYPHMFTDELLQRIPVLSVVTNSNVYKRKKNLTIQSTQTDVTDMCSRDLCSTWIWWHVRWGIIKILNSLSVCLPVNVQTNRISITELLFPLVWTHFYAATLMTCGHG
jgi:hypothetical protein